MSTTTEPLTQGQKRIKIAEACGWTHICEQESTADDDTNGELYLSGKHPESTALTALIPIPDYFGSRDDMNEAEEILGDNRWTYLELLGAVSEERAPHPWGASIETIWEVKRRTAAECAEAFGKALALW